MFTQDVKLHIFTTIMGFSNSEVVLMAETAERMVHNMEFQRSADPDLNDNAEFLYNMDGAKLALVIAQQRVKDLGKPAAEQAQNMRGLCAMLEIEFYEQMPAPEDLPDLGEYGLKF